MRSHSCQRAPAARRRTFREWADVNGHKVALWAKDEGVSGSNGLENRLGLLEAFDSIRKGSTTGLVIYRLDRLARDLVLQEQLLAEVRRLGGMTFSTSSAESSFLADDPDDPSRKLIRQVLGAVSEYERSMIVLRLKSGRRRKAELGGFAYGAPRYGQRSESGVLVEDESECIAIERALDLRREGASLRTIAERLTEEGHRPRRGSRWHPQTVSRILQDRQA